MMYQLRLALKVSGDAVDDQQVNQGIEFGLGELFDLTVRIEIIKMAIFRNWIDLRPLALVQGVIGGAPDRSGR